MSTQPTEMEVMSVKAAIVTTIERARRAADEMYTMADRLEEIAIDAAMSALAERLRHEADTIMGALV